jgi:hypothetical protein
MKNLGRGFAGAFLLMAACSAWAGPPQDTSADKVIDDFEGKLEWRAQPQNNVSVKLDQPQALGHSGQASLLVTATSGAIGEKGRNAFRLVRDLPKDVNCEGFEGVQLWLKTVAGAGDLRLCLHMPGGVRYRYDLQINPADEGDWKFFRIPFDEFAWDFESAKTTIPKADPKAIIGLSLWRQMWRPSAMATKAPKADAKTVFYADDVALYKQKPPYNGPTIGLRSSAGKAIVRPGADLRILGRITKPKDAKDYSLDLKLRDYFGKALLEKTLPVTPDAKGEFAFEVPARQSPYCQVAAILSQAGKVIYTEDYAVATIPELSPSQKAVTGGDSPFGMWVGGLAFAMEQGVRWYRGYCEPWQFEPDQAGGCRYVGKGTFPPAKMPYEGATPIYFFRGMSKWLSSRPDRVDYQKFPPKDWNEYARFVTWYVGKMKQHVKHWEVWNEPVPYAYWMGTIEEMVRLHEVTYKAVKAADPDAIVLGPCPYSFLFDFLDRFFQLGGGRWIDAVVIHAYTVGAPEPGELDINLQKVREMAMKYIGARHLYITELGWDASRVGQTAQAQYLVRSHVLAMEAGVKALIWHMYWDYVGVGSAGYAIVNHNQTPRPALVAYCTLMRMLTGTRFSRRLSEFKDPVRAYEFVGEGRKVIVAWCWIGAAKVRIPVAKEKVELVNIVGESHTVPAQNGAIEMSLDGNPVYLCE